MKLAKMMTLGIEKGYNGPWKHFKNELEVSGMDWAQKQSSRLRE